MIFRYQWVGLRIVHCLVSMLKKLRPVVCGLTLQWSRGVHMNPKEYHVAAVSWLNICKKKSRLALLESLWISPLTTNERTLDTLIFHIRIFNLWWVHKNMDFWYCHISILIKINHFFITCIINVVSFIHHLCVIPYKWMGKTWCGKSAAKYTEIDKTPHVLVLNMSFCLFLSQNNSF